MDENTEDVFQDAYDFTPSASIKIAAQNVKNAMNKGVVQIQEASRQLEEEEEEKVVPSRGQTVFKSIPNEEVGGIEEVEESETRELLPYFCDPKSKIGIWAVIKDSIGKDISKITVPVYFNEPLSLLQRFGAVFEYQDILEKALTE